MANDNEPENNEELNAANKAALRNQILCAYICGCVAVLSSFIGNLGASIIPIAFGLLGCFLAWQLKKKGQNLHSAIVVVILLIGVAIKLVAMASG